MKKLAKGITREIIIEDMMIKYKIDKVEAESMFDLIILYFEITKKKQRKAKKKN